MLLNDERRAAIMHYVDRLGARGERLGAGNDYRRQDKRTVSA